MQALENTQPGDGKSKARTGDVQRAYAFSDLSDYSFKDRLLIRLADVVFYLIIKLIGSTAKFEVEGWENKEAIDSAGKLPIYCFWHERMFLTTYWWRFSRGVVVSSKSFDAEYTGRVIKRFGFGTVRGSSTRGGVGAFIELARLMRAGCPAGFTLDGPKGPPRVAKMGPVVLAKRTGNPILAVTMEPAKYWTLRTWDTFQIPKPFTRAKIFVAEPIYVAATAADEELEMKRQELQSALDDLTQRGEQWRASL
jgi:lysophospholipid acyltransferase (LPLAT)-like uncharacterized protein